MREFKGTPGPWKVTEIDDDLSEMSSTMIVASGLVVACVGPSGNTCLEDDMKNANLIAAAPELLKELQELVNCVVELENHYDFDSDTLVKDARAAITKALGE